MDAKPMSEERLLEIEGTYVALGAPGEFRTPSLVVRQLIAEVKRLRAALQKLGEGEGGT